MLRVLIYCVLFALVPVVAWFVTRRVSRYERRLVGVVLVVVPTSLITFIMVVTGHGHGRTAVLSANYDPNKPATASTLGSVPEAKFGQTSSEAPPLVRAEPAPPVVAPSVFGPPALGPAVARTSASGGRPYPSGPAAPVIAPANIPGPILSVPLPPVTLPSTSPIKPPTVAPPPPPKPSPPSKPTTTPPTTKPTTPPPPPPSTTTDAPAPTTEPSVTAAPPTTEQPPPPPPLPAPTSEPVTAPVDTLV